MRLRQRLAQGDRKTLGEASSVAREVLDDPALAGPLIDCLEDEDEAVVAHAAHAVMQVGGDRPELFEPHADRLLAILGRCDQWEIGEQLPKVLAAMPLDDSRVRRLSDMLIAQTGASSNIAAASALSGLVDLAVRGRIPRAIAREQVDIALKSPRKALAARARRLASRLEAG